MRLLNKVAVITGSSRGLGAAIAKAFSKEASVVAITYNTNKDAAYEVAKSINTDLVVHLDVKNRESIKKAFKIIYDRCNKIDILVNNAGINRIADFDQQTEEEWNEVIDVNLSGVFRCCQEILPFISDGGRIINIGSLSGEYGGPRTPSYAVSKMGLMALTHNLARFLGHRNICVNTISPGIIANEFAEKTMVPKVKEMAMSLLLLKRFASYEDIVGAAVFLASDEASYITAQTISINGGAWVR